MVTGRPTKYKKEYVTIAKSMCKLGAVDIDLAEAFEVSIRTIHQWKTEHKDFSHSLKASKKGYDDAVERSLAQRAIGYTHEETDIKVINGEIVETKVNKHYPPDTRACLAWLYNRRSKKWHPQPIVAEDEKAPPLSITFEVAEPVGKIKTTNAST